MDPTRVDVNLRQSLSKSIYATSARSGLPELTGNSALPSSDSGRSHSSTVQSTSLSGDDSMASVAAGSVERTTNVVELPTPLPRKGRRDGVANNMGPKAACATKANKADSRITKKARR